VTGEDHNTGDNDDIYITHISQLQRTNVSTVRERREKERKIGERKRRDRKK
jgi:hypothetical protein